MTTTKGKTKVSVTKEKAKAPAKKVAQKSKPNKQEQEAVAPGSLAERAMLVRLNISCWGAKRNDSSVAQEVANNHKAEAAMGKYTKILLKSEAREDFRKVAREAYKLHRYMTLPWDEGTGLLPSTMYFKYSEAMEEKRRQAKKFIDKFVEEYTEQWNNGMGDYKKVLGSLFNESDYPDPAHVRSKFGIRVRVFPITNPNDFRVQMSEEQKGMLREQMLQDYQSDISEALKVPFFRLHKVLTKVHEKLADEDAVFRDSLIENVQELMEILPDLNITGNKDLEALLTKTNKEIAGITDMKALRKDPQYRQQVAKSAADILGKIKGYVS